MFCDPHLHNYKDVSDTAPVLSLLSYFSDEKLNSYLTYKIQSSQKFFKKKKKQKTKNKQMFEPLQFHPLAIRKRRDALSMYNARHAIFFLTTHLLKQTLLCSRQQDY